MTARTLTRDVWLLACDVQLQLRGRRKKYWARALGLAKRLPHMPDGVYKGAAFCMLVLLVVSAARAKPGSGQRQQLRVEAAKHLLPGRHPHGGAC